MYLMYNSQDEQSVEFDWQEHVDIIHVILTLERDVYKFKHTTNQQDMNWWKSLNRGSTYIYIYIYHYTSL